MDLMRVVDTWMLSVTRSVLFDHEIARRRFEPCCSLATWLPWGDMRPALNEVKKEREKESAAEDGSPMADRQTDRSRGLTNRVDSLCFDSGQGCWEDTRRI